MGACLDCLSPSKQDTTPDPEERRRRLEEAATKRQKENESRGLKDPQRVKRKQQKKEAAEKEALRAGHHGETGLKGTSAANYARECTAPNCIEELKWTVG